MERSKESIGNQLPTECQVLWWVFKLMPGKEKWNGFFVCLFK